MIPKEYPTTNKIIIKSRVQRASLQDYTIRTGRFNQSGKPYVMFAELWSTPSSKIKIFVDFENLSYFHLLGIPGPDHYRCMVFKSPIWARSCRTESHRVHGSLPSDIFFFLTYTVYETTKLIIIILS